MITRSPAMPRSFGRPGFILAALAVALGNPVHAVAVAGTNGQAVGVADPEGVTFLGEILDASKARLVIREGAREGEARTVLLAASTRFPSGKNGLLVKGATVVVNALPSRNGELTARMVAVLSPKGATLVDPQTLSAALNQGLAKTQPAFSPSSAAGTAVPNCQAISSFRPTSDMLDFTGCLGYGSYTYGGDIDVSIFRTPVVSDVAGRALVEIFIKRFEFSASGGGGSFELPFRFSAVDPAAEALEDWINYCKIYNNGSLDGCEARKAKPSVPGPGTPRTVRVNAKAVDPSPALMFTVGGGLLVRFDLRIETGIGCGPVGTDRCSYALPVPPFGFLANYAQARGAPPQAPGSTVRAEAVACTTFGISTLLPPVIGGLISPFDVLVCQPLVFEAPAAGFQAQVSGVSAAVQDFGQVPNPTLQFSGAPRFVQATPSGSGDYSVRFSGFDYRPIVQQRFQFKLRTSGLYVFAQSDEWLASRGYMPLVTTPFPSLEQIFPPMPVLIPSYMPPLPPTAPVNVPLLQGAQPTSIDILIKVPVIGVATIDDFAPKGIDSAGGTVIRVVGHGFAQVPGLGGSGVSRVVFDGVDVPFTVISNDELQIFPGPHDPIYIGTLALGVAALNIHAWGSVIHKEVFVPARPLMGFFSRPVLSSAGGALLELAFFNPSTGGLSAPPVALSDVWVGGVPTAFARCDPGSTSPLCAGNTRGAWVAISPPHDAGSVHVKVRAPCVTESASFGSAPCGTSTEWANDVAFYQGLPQLDAVTPSQGLPSGGGQITLSGSGFLGFVHVTINGIDTKTRFPGDLNPPGICNWDGNSAAGALVLRDAPQLACPGPASDTSLTVTIPPGTPGDSVPIQIRIDCPNTIDSQDSPTFGSSCGASAAVQYKYFGAPGIGTLIPQDGTWAGGTAVTINGRGFTSATRVLFGAASAPFTIVSDAQITTNAPRGYPDLVSNVPGSLKVTVVTSCGTGTAGVTSCGTSNGVDYTYDPPADRPPTALSVANASGATSGTLKLAATLMEGSGGLAGKTIAFTLLGGAVGTAVTNGAGVAVLGGVSLANVGPGTYAAGISASYAGEFNHLPSGATSPLTVTGTATMTVASVNGILGRAATLTAIARADGAPLIGIQVDFSLAGLSVGSASTGANGIATLSAIVPTSLAAITFSNGVAATAPTHAVSATASLTLQQDQIITFAAQADLPLDHPARGVTASSSAGLAVNISSATPSVCTVSSGQLQGLSVGVCTLVATQAGTDVYPAALAVPRSFNVVLATQVITFDAMADLPLDFPTRTIAPFASSGLPVAVTSETPVVCDVVPDNGATHTVTGHSVGLCILVARQAGDGTYQAALEVPQSFSVVHNHVAAFGTNNSAGQLNVPAEAVDVSSVSVAGNLSLALKTDGTVLQWGAEFVVPAELRLPPLTGYPQAIALSAGADPYGNSHAVAVMNDGTLRVWGQTFFSSSNPTIPRVAPPLAGVVAVAAGGEDLALLADGSVLGFRQDFGLPSAFSFPLWPAGGSSPKAVAIASGLGSQNYAILLIDGSVRYWGFNGSNYTYPGTAAGPYRAIAVEQASPSQSWLLALGTNGVVTRISMIDGSSTSPLTGTFTSISAGESGGAAVSSGRTISTYGATPSAANLRTVAAVAVGRTHGIATSDEDRAQPFLTFVAEDPSLGLADVAAVSTPQNAAITLSVSLRASQPTALAAGLPGKTISLSFGGVLVGSAVTDSRGIAAFPPLGTSALAPGTHSGVLTASFVGNNLYKSGRAAADLNVLAPAIPQSITFTTLAAVAYGAAPFAASAVASSGLPVILSVGSGPATLAGNLLTITGAGSVVLHAAQAGNSRYLAASADQAIAVAKAPLTVKADDLFVPRSVGFANPVPLTGVVTGILGGDAIIASYTTTAQSSTNGPLGWHIFSPAGTYPITPLLTGPVGNYQVTVIAGTFTVQPPPPSLNFAQSGGLDFYRGPPYQLDDPTLTINADFLAVSFNRPTNILDVATSVSTSGGAPIGSSTAILDNGSTLATLASAAGFTPTFFRLTLASGDHRLTAIVTENGINSSPSNVVTGTISTPRVPQTIAFGALADKTYGDSFTLAAAASSGLALSYSISGPASLSFGNLVTITGVGPVTITASQAGDAGHFAAADVTLSFAVVARPITVTANAKSKTYGNADPALSYSITSGTLVASDAFSGNLTREAGENVNAYAIQQGTLALGGNYALTFAGAHLTIGAKAILVVAHRASKVYGATDPVLTYQLLPGSLVSGDALTGSLARSSGENVGLYDIQQGTLAGSNYAISFLRNSFLIGAKAITVTAIATSKIYGDADPALTYSSTPGALVGGDAFSGSLTREAGENVGVHAIQQGTFALSTNYSLTFVSASLSITARPITVTADTKTKIYGEDADPALTYSSTPVALVGSDAFSGSLTREAGENAGAHAIQQGTLTLGTNYALTFVGASLRITARPITVTAQTETKIYGDPDPTLTYSITSGTLVGTDAFIGSVTSDTGGNVGVHAIQQGTLTLGTNYALTFVGANLSITARPITVTADLKTKLYGDADPTLTYSITSGTLVVIDGFSGNLARVAGENAGAYPIQQGTLALGNNYALTFTGANLAINKATPVLTWTGALSGTYNQPSTLMASLAFGPASAISGTAMSSQTVTFALAPSTPGAQSCAGLTQASGVASCTLKVNQPHASYTAAASFAGDNNFLPASITTSFDVALDPTTTVYTGASKGEYLGWYPLSTLVTETSSGFPAAEGTLVHFALGLPELQGCSGTVLANGTASCSLQIEQSAGSYPIIATASGNAYYDASSASANFLVSADTTIVVYTGPALIANGLPLTISATFRDTFTNTPVAGAPLAFTLGLQGCSATTDINGIASCTISKVAQPLGPMSIATSFAGSNYYLPATASNSVLVFAYLPGGGSFVIADTAAQVGSEVMFWGSRWGRVNHPSGGPAPRRFKGFADSPAHPACGTGFTAHEARAHRDDDDDEEDGDGPRQPSNAPAYQAVIASSSIRKAHSSIVGDSRKIVIIKTAAGYAPNRGHAGTGTVVAVLCGGLPGGTTASAR